MNELLASQVQPSKIIVQPAERGRLEKRRATFEAMLIAQLGRTFALAAVILGDESEAEDAVQDAIEKAWRSLHQLTDDGRAEAWFRRIVVNSCRDRIRRRRRRRQFEIVGRRNEPSSVDDLEHFASRDQLKVAFERLSADERIAVVLRYQDDLTVPAIADALGIPEGTAKSRLHYALQKLRTALERGDEP